MEAFKIKYDITLPARVIFVLAYPPGIVTHLAGYEIIFPIPQSITLKGALRGIKERIKLKDKLVTRLDLVDKEIKASTRHIIVDSEIDPAGTRGVLLLKLYNEMKVSTIINSVIPSAEDRDIIHRSMAKALVDAKSSVSQVSLQDVIGYFLKNLPSHLR